MLCSALGRYDLIDYYLDPAKAASAALARSKELSRTAYVLVSQIDVYPSYSITSELLRVDGLNA